MALTITSSESIGLALKLSELTGRGVADSVVDVLRERLICEFRPLVGRDSVPFRAPRFFNLSLTFGGVCEGRKGNRAASLLETCERMAGLLAQEPDRSVEFGIAPSPQII